MPGAQIEWRGLVNESKTEGGSHLRHFKLFVLQIIKFSNSGTYFVNEIELYVVNYLLFAPTRFASVGNVH